MWVTSGVEQNRIAFLDVLVTRLDVSLSTSVYRKPTHTDCYIPLSPFQNNCWSHERYERTGFCICDNISLRGELEHLEKVFQANELPNRLIKKILSVHPKNLPSDSSTPVQQDWPKTLCVPYIKGISGKLERVCAPLGIRVVFKTMNTLRRSLVHVKTKLPSDKKDVVYTVPCKDCSSIYVGETMQYEQQIRRME